MKKLRFIVPLAVYPFDVLVCFGQTDKEVRKLLDKYSIGEEGIELCMFTSDTVRARTVMLDGNQTIIRMRHIPETCEDYADLQHEIFHAVTFVMHRVGMSLELMASDEAYAYLIGYLTKIIYKKISDV
jgi:hypothetical protein